MSERARLLTAAMNFMLDEGILVLGSTVGGGIALGPQGALVGGLFSVTSTVVGRLISSPWWRRFSMILISNLQLVYPFIRDRMDVVNDLLQNIAELLMRVLQRSGLVASSNVLPLNAGGGNRPPPTN